METEKEPKIGDFIYDSWGYDQTNIDYAMIIKVSKTGKTVVAKRCRVKVVEDWGQSEGLIPISETFGDEFRLQVRVGGRYVGSYPYCFDGLKNDGQGVRSGYFSEWKGQTLHQTLTQFGH